MKITIGTNRTRYSSEDLQTFTDWLLRVAQGLGITPTPGWLHHDGDKVVEVAYWKGDPGEIRQLYNKNGGSDRLGGPWFTNNADNTNSSRLLLLTPEKVTRAMSTLEALAQAGEEGAYMYQGMQEQVGVFLLRNAGYSCEVRGRRYALHSPRVMSTLVVRAMRAQGVGRVGILPNVVDPREKGSSAAHIQQLRRTFEKGEQAYKVSAARHWMVAVAKQHREAWEKNEVQRQRLIARGVTPAAQPTTIELLERLLAAEKRRK